MAYVRYQNVKTDDDDKGVVTFRQRPALPSKPLFVRQAASQPSQVRNNDEARKVKKKPPPIAPRKRTASGISGHLPIQTDNFVSACKELKTLLIQCSESKLLNKSFFDERTLSLDSLRRMERIAERKEVDISVFGQQNCGKSTLTNALVGDEFLSTSEFNETSVRVVIRHDSNVHQGYCCGGECKAMELGQRTCPTLTIRTQLGTSKVSGPKEIKSELKAINKAIRDSKNGMISKNRVVITSKRVSCMLKMEQDGTVVCNGKFEHFSSSEYIFEIIPSEIKKAVKLQSVKYPKMYLAICFERVFGTVSPGPESDVLYEVENDLYTFESAMCPGAHIGVLDDNHLAIPEKTSKALDVAKFQVAVLSKTAAIMPSSLNELILQVYMPMLAENVPRDWNVSLVDAPGLGERNFHVQRLAEEALESSSAYVHLLLPESIGGKDVGEIFNSLAGKVPEAFSDGRLIIAVTKFDKNYESHQQDSSESDENEDYDATANYYHLPNYKKIEEMTKHKVRESIQDATGLDISPDIIFPICGKWALQGSRLESYLQNNPDPRSNDEIYTRRLRRAAQALNKHPAQSEISLPGAQGQSELEVTSALGPHKIAANLEQLTGLEPLKRSIQCMVSRCIRLWLVKVSGENIGYIREAKRKINHKLQELEEINRATRSELQVAETMFKDVSAIYQEVKNSATLKERSVVWRAIDSSYDKDVAASMVISEGEKLISAMADSFKQQCTLKMTQRSKETFGEAQFTQDLNRLLSDTERELGIKFDTVCKFSTVYNSIGDYSRTMGKKCGTLESNATLLCKHLNTLKIPQPSLSENKLSSHELSIAATNAPKLGDIKEKVEIPPVKLSMWDKFWKKIKALIKKATDDEVYSYSCWDEDLTKTLQVTEDHMKQRCQAYFAEIKHQTVEHFYEEYSKSINSELIEFETNLRQPAETGIANLKELIQERRAMQRELKGMIEKLGRMHEKMHESLSNELSRLASSK